MDHLFDNVKLTSDVAIYLTESGLDIFLVLHDVLLNVSGGSAASNSCLVMSPKCLGIITLKPFERSNAFTH